jgi:hypothetical protein
MFKWSIATLQNSTVAERYVTNDRIQWDEDLASVPRIIEIDCDLNLIFYKLDYIELQGQKLYHY